MFRVYSLHGVLFVLHRITGGFLVAYLIAHIATISTALIGGRSLFDATFELLASPAFIALEVMLLGCVTFHALNGLRLILGERGVGLETSDHMARGTVVITIMVWFMACGLAFAA